MARRNLVVMKLTAVLIALVLVLVACGGDDDEAEPTPEPTTPPAAEPTPTEPPAVTDDDATDDDGDDAVPDTGDLVGQGEGVFMQNCAVCHGDDASGFMAADVRGRDASAVEAALRGVPEMSGVRLSREEVEAVGAYLQSLR